VLPKRRISVKSLKESSKTFKLMILSQSGDPDSLTPWSRVLLEKLVVTELVKKLPAFYETQRFIMFTRACHWSLSWARCIQSTPSHSIFQKFTLTLSSHLHLGLQSGLFPSDFLTKVLYAFLISSIHYTCPVHLILLDFITVIFGEVYKLQSSF
jgi:hypothetical protein